MLSGLSFIPGSRKLWGGVTVRVLSTSKQAS